MPDQIHESTKPRNFLSAIIRVVLAVVEALGLMLALVMLLNVSVSLVFWLSLVIFLASIFVFISGRSVPRIQSRGKGLVVASVTGICLMASGTIHRDQREEYLAELRSTDLNAYLRELERIDEERWLTELETLRPEQFQAETVQREQEAQAERQRKCSDRKLGEAYVMIQNDVRKQLRAPATADFPARYGRGTRNEGDCIYRVVGHVDAENSFGALIRASFEGRIAYFPDTRSWRTIELSVGG